MWNDLQLDAVWTHSSSLEMTFKHSVITEGTGLEKHVSPDWHVNNNVLYLGCGNKNICCYILQPLIRNLSKRIHRVCHISKHPKENYREYLWRAARCLVMWSNFVFSAGYIFCFETKTRQLKVAEHSFRARFCWCDWARAQGLQKQKCRQ